MFHDFLLSGGMYVPQQAFAQVAMAGYTAMPNTGINPVSFMFIASSINVIFLFA